MGTLCKDETFPLNNSLTFKKLRFLLIVLCLNSACSAVQRVDDLSTNTRSYLEIECSPPDASVCVNGGYMGDVDGWSGGIIPLKPGLHRIELQHSDFFSYQFDLTLLPGRMASLKLDLIERALELDDSDADTSTDPSSKSLFIKRPGHLNPYNP